MRESLAYISVTEWSFKQEMNESVAYISVTKRTFKQKLSCTGNGGGKRQVPVGEGRGSYAGKPCS